MHNLRAYARDHTRVWILILLAAVLIKAVIPSGYMVAPSSEKLVEISICHGMIGERDTAQIANPTKLGSQGTEPLQDRGDTQCAFSGLLQHALGGVSPELLAVALAAILVLGLAPIAKIAPAPSRYLRPPLRGPPLQI